MIEVFDVSSLALPALPANWHYRTVKEIGASGEQPVLTGPFGTNLGCSDFIETGVPLLTIGCLTQSGINLDKALFVSEAKAEELSRYRLKAGDLLFSRMASVGRAGLVPKWLEGALFNYHIMRLRLDESRIDTRLFINYVRGAPQVRDYLKAVNHGATRDGINTEQLLGLPIAVPPIGEQREIVAEIEKQFSRLDEAVANLQRVKANLKRYKASVLNDAVEGRLVEGDYQYELVKLGSVANLIDPQPSHRTPPTHADGVPYIGIGDVLENGKVDLQNSRKVSLTVLAEHRARYTLRMGDFIFGKIGTLGKPTLLMPPYDYTLSANVVLVQADGVRLLPEYALIFMESPKLVNIVNRDAKATTQAAYGIKRMRDLNIELPNIDLQRRIIAEVDRRLSLIRGVVAEVDANLQRAQTLRISILATAFQSGAGGV